MQESARQVEKAIALIKILYPSSLCINPPVAVFHSLYCGDIGWNFAVATVPWSQLTYRGIIRGEASPWLVQHGKFRCQGFEDGGPHLNHHAPEMAVGLVDTVLQSHSIFCAQDSYCVVSKLLAHSSYSKYLSDPKDRSYCLLCRC